MPPKAQKALQRFGVGNGISLKGVWTFDPKTWAYKSFHGKLLGDYFEVMDYRFRALTADLSSNADSVYITKFKIDDKAGEFFIPGIGITKMPDGDWWLEAPELRVSNWSPSIFGKKGSLKTLVVRELSLKDVHGRVFAPASLKGRGEMHFRNFVNESLLSGILVIPRDILSRLGLTLGVLTPVMGSIYFDVQKSRVYLNKLASVYSEDKRSRFYLDKHASASFIDFDGNLNINIKMKQHNLIFKIAELFTINVSGTVNKPRYNLVRLPIPGEEPVFGREKSEF